MYIKKGKGPVLVTLKDGSAMSRADLPPKSTRRWVASRKAAVVRAVNAGLISEEEACELYSLSVEELTSWRETVQQHGESALRTMALQKKTTIGRKYK